MIIAVATATAQNSAYRHRKYEGRFRKRRRPSLFFRQSRIDVRSNSPQDPVMPTVLRIGPYRFHFYSRESNEPPHIHVAREDFEVKFWLRPISVAFNYGFASSEVNDILRLVEQNCDFLLEAYRRFHGNR